MNSMRVSALRLSLTGAITMLVLFIACWLGTVIGGLPATHQYIGLFTSSEATSFIALCVGSFRSLVWGGFAGALVALSYSLLAGIDRPGPSSGTRS